MVIIVPDYIPILAEVQVSTFFCIDLCEFSFLLCCVFIESQQVKQGRKIHEVASVDSYVHSIDFVDAWFLSACFTAVFDVIDD